MQLTSLRCRAPFLLTSLSVSIYGMASKKRDADAGMFVFRAGDLATMWGETLWHMCALCHGLRESLATMTCCPRLSPKLQSSSCSGATPRCSEVTESQSQSSGSSCLRGAQLRTNALSSRHGLHAFEKRESRRQKGKAMESSSSIYFAYNSGRALWSC